MKRKRGQAAVAMSGGIDSSVAAALLLEQGYNVIGLTFDNRSEAGPEKRTIQDARRVAQHLGIRHVVLNAAEHFERHVIRPFLEAYTGGMTPVPCAMCNRSMKFGLLLERALELGADFLASGHYAGIHGEETLSIHRPKDRERDQTYFLYDIPRERLCRIRFPLSSVLKTEVRQRARRLGLPVAERPPSRDICFVENAKTRNYLAKRLAVRPGLIVDMDGRRLGEHEGVHFFTVGQRRGLSLGGKRAGLVPVKPMHVIALDGPGNRVIVGPEEELFSSSCVVSGVNFFFGDVSKGSIIVKIRSGHPGAAAKVRTLGRDRIKIDFLSPQRAVTPGQAAVFYRDENVLGGGVIQEAGRPALAGAGR